MLRCTEHGAYSGEVGCKRLGSELRCKPGLFADFVGSNAIDVRMALNGDGGGTVGEDGMVSTLTDKTEAILLEVADQVFALDRH